MGNSGNNYPKYYYDMQGRQRGTLLTLWLGFLILANAVFILMTISEIFGLFDNDYLSRDLNRNMLQVFLIGDLIIQSVIFIFIIALWNWKRWGFHGLILAYLISILLNIYVSNGIAVIFGGVGLGISTYLVGKVYDWLE